MSASSVINKRHKAVTPFEIIVFVVIFATVLVLLYPKESLKKQVLAEKSNYALTVMYLKNMLKLEPQNTELMVATAKAAIEQGNIDLATELLVLLKKQEDPKLAYSLKMIQFKILKHQTIHESNTTKLSSLESAMKTTLATIIQHSKITKEDRIYWFLEALRLKEKPLALLFLRPLYQTDDPFALEQCVYLAGEIKQKQIQKQCGERLLKLPQTDRKKWLLTAYKFYTAMGDNIKRGEVLKELVTLEPSHQEEYAKVLAAVGDFGQAAKIYQILFQASIDMEVKKQLLYKTIEALSYGKKPQEAEAFAIAHESLYQNDEAFIQSLIKLYWASQNLPASRRLSLRLLQEVEK